MADSFIRYTGDGSTSEFSVPFDYISKGHVRLFVDGVDTDFEWVNAGSISPVTVPASGSDVIVQRETPKSPLVDFSSGAVINESELDLLTRQNVYISEETRDRSLIIDEDGTVDAKSSRLTNVADPVDPQDIATRNWAENETTSFIVAAEAEADAASQSATDADLSAADAQASEDAAAVSETNAASSESAAATSEANAKTSENAAAASESAAATSESNAASSENAAASSETAAANSASAALSSENAAASSESAAATSESNAADSETAASNSASAAATSESNAATSESNAAASESAAATSESNAASSESLANQWAEESEDVEVTAGSYSAKHHAFKAFASENAASTSESNAASSASAASDNASAAATSESNAASSETAAANSASEASTSASNAAASELAASASESNAASSESNAAASESAAATSESNAASSESLANQWAEENEDVEVTTGAYSAKHHSLKASASESAASTSESNAASSATDAANSASAASTSETNAASSETAAANSASAASTSESNAATSESNAADSASAASTSESNAATSETNAAASESLANDWAEEAEDVEVETGSYSAKHHANKASASASAASTSESNAASSATNAANSASSASTSESNAATSESNAATSETNAASSESAAASSETNAADSASAASTSESNAASSESKAGLWAEEDENVEVEAGAYSAYHWAKQAQSYATGDISLDQIVQSGATDGQQIVWDGANSEWIAVTVTPFDVGAEPAGTASSEVDDHEAKADPHSQYAQSSDLASVATSGNAVDVSISDSGGNFNATDVEAALTEEADARQAHESDTTNPHSVTASQVGADPEGTASSAVSSHESASDPHKQYALESSLATVATSGSFNDLLDKPSTGMPSGTRMLFYQANAPTGWSQVTSLNDRVLRVVSGNGGSTGGSWSISGLNVEGHTLSTSEIPSHSHSGSTSTDGYHSHSGSTNTTGNHQHELYYGKNSDASDVRDQGSYQYMTETENDTGHSVYYSLQPFISSAGNHSHSLSINGNGNHNHSLSINNTGGDGSHSHGISHDGNWRPAYADVIVCEKN